MRLRERRHGIAPLAAGLATAAAFALTLAAPSAASAQGVGLEVDGGYRALAGDDFDGLEDGWAVHALGSYGWETGWEAGAGVGISFHDPEVGDADGDITEVVGFLRYRFGVPGAPVKHLHPFVEGRAGLTRFSTSTATDDDVSQDGVLLGGQAGVEYWLSDAVGVVGAAGLEYLDFSADDGLADRAGLSLRPHVGLKLRY